MNLTTLKKELSNYQLALEDHDNLTGIGIDLVYLDKGLIKSDYFSLEGIDTNKLSGISIESVTDEIYKFFKAVMDAAKKFWKMIVGYAIKFGNVIRKVLGRLANYAKRFFSKEEQVKVVAEEAKRLIKLEQEKSNPDMDTVNQIVNTVASIVDNNEESSDVQTTSEAISKIDTITSTPIRLKLDNIRYQIDQSNFNLFGYDKNQEVFTVSQIERQKKINDHYYRLVEAFKEHLNADVFVDTLKSIPTDKLTAKQLRKTVCDKMIEPFYTVDKVDDTDNLTPDNRIDVRPESVKKIYQSDASSNPLNTFKKALKSLGGQLLPVDQSRFVKATNIVTNRASMNTMLESIQTTIKNIEQNRAHLYIDDKQIQDGFMLTDSGLKRLLHDLRLDKHQYVKQIGNVIIDLARTVDILINQQHHTWLMVTNAQLLLLNKQIKAISDAKPILLK